MPIKAAIEEFAQRIQKMIEGHAMERAKSAVLEAFGLHAPKKRGRPPKALASLPALPSATKGTSGPDGMKKARKKLPPQFCPVPGCKNKAAPVFGMVCAQHKDVAKSKIKKYREERKAQKHGKTKQGKPAGKPAGKKTARKSVVRAGAKKTPGKKVRAKAVGRKAPKRPSTTASVAKPASVASPPAASVATAS
jgi:hypothetical protein